MIMRDYAVGDEIMRALDVQVVDLRHRFLVVDSRDDVERGMFRGHDHSGADRRGGNEWQRSGEQMPLQHVSPTERVANAFCDTHQLAEIPARSLESPALTVFPRGTDAQAKIGECLAIGGVNADYRNAMHRASTAPVAAKRDHDVAPVRVPALRNVVRTIDVEVRIFEQAQGRIGGIERSEDPADVARVMHQAVAAFALARTNGRVGSP